MSIAPTSYFSKPAETLDPTLFQGRNIRPWARTGILHLLKDFFDKEFKHQELWSHVWLAGSGVSYQWSAARQPGDLDCLVGINYVQFRKANPAFSGFSDKDISFELNERFREELQPTTENWNGYELTFYVNPGATDIRVIKPYAAYDLTYDEWTVSPNPTAQPPVNASWDAIAEADAKATNTIGTRFTSALQDVKTSHSGPLRRNAESRLLAAAQQGTALLEELHTNRKLAFSSTGQGYDDFHNYRWQAAKRNGVVPALKQLKDYIKTQTREQEQQLYGSELPDTNTLIRRAALYRAK